MDIQAVAKLARVSTATVSRVINHSPKVRPQTAEHVMRIVEQTSYVPNRSARSLRVRHSRLFGLIVSDVKNSFFPDLIDAFESLAAANQIDVIFTHTNYDPQRLEHCLRRLVERNVDGIAVMTSEVDLEALAHVRQRNIPLVLLDQPGAGKGFNTVEVTYDYHTAVDHLRTLGHTKIGFLAGPMHLGSVKRRHDSFVDSMKKSGLLLRKEWVISSELQVAGGQDAAARMLALVPRPTALLTTNDLMAVGALLAADAAGIEVPRDLSIIGFDDLPVAAMVNPALTTMHVSRTEIAQRAFAFLLHATRPEGKPLARKRSIRPMLVVRGSTAPPAGARSRRLKRATPTPVPGPRPHGTSAQRKPARPPAHPPARPSRISA